MSAEELWIKLVQSLSSSSMSMSMLSASLLSLSLSLPFWAVLAEPVPFVFQGNAPPADVPFVFAAEKDRVEAADKRTGYAELLTLSRGSSILLQYLSHGVFQATDNGRVGEQRSLLDCPLHDRIPEKSRLQILAAPCIEREGGRRSAPVELLHNLPRDVRFGHILELWVRGELLLRDVFHAGEERGHPLLRMGMSEGSYPRTVGTRRAEPTLCRNPFSSSRRRRSNSPDFLNLGPGSDRCGRDQEETESALFDQLLGVRDGHPCAQSRELVQYR